MEAGIVRRRKEGSVMAIVRWSPFQELEAMERRMRRLFEEGGFAPALVPNADVFETENEFVVELEVPGFEEKELEIEVTDHTLCVKGHRIDVKEEKEKTYQLHERLEKTFERRFTLPVEADMGKVKASYEKGVLEIHTAKVKETAPKKVAIAKK
jgi:HSP20 family protein